MHTIQANYPKKLPTTYWDTLNIQYPVRKFPDTGLSSETIALQPRGQPEILKHLKDHSNEVRECGRNYNITDELTRSQTALDFTYKAPETKRFTKHTSCTENKYIYPPSRRLAERIPRCTSHGTTEMRNAYTSPDIGPRLVTDKDQYKYLASLQFNPPPVEPSWHKELEPLDTTHEGFEKYLDPYLTTSRLHHRPYTADQLSKLSVSKDNTNFYTFANVPWTRTPKPRVGDWHLPLSRPKSMYDREKFKEDFREIRTHNRAQYVPGTFRTETRDNYVPPLSRPEGMIHNYEEDARTHYQRSTANLPTNTYVEHCTIKRRYTTENSIVGSIKPICSILDQYVEKNKRLERKSISNE